MSTLSSRLVRVRRRMGARLVDEVFLRAAQIGRLTPVSSPKWHDLDFTRDVSYGPRSEHTLDVYKPRDATGAPVVFYAHGGAFRSLSKDTHWLMGLAFAREGLVVAVPNYRLAPRHRFPAALEDVAEALCYVKAHAREWGGDPNRIILAGESAGANLVTSLALCIAYEREEPYALRMREAGVDPIAVLAACGVFEVTDGHRFAARQDIGWFVDDRMQELADYAEWVDGAPIRHDLLNPLVLLEREPPKRPLPPFFLPVGEKDILKIDTARMEAILKVHGADVDARVYAGGVHAFHAFVFRKAARQCWRDHFDFLATRGIHRTS